MRQSKNPKTDNRSINKHLADIVTFLKRTKIKKDGATKNLYASPWFLVIGPSQSGKTTLLSKSDVNFKLKRNFRDNNNIPPSRNYDFWVAKNAVFIDTPGKLFNTANQERTIVKTKSFLKFLKKNCYQKSLKGILVVLDTKDIFYQKQNKSKKFHKIIQKQIQDIEKHFSYNVPIYIVLNKCDLITGFREFFSELSQEERWQLWGLSLNASHHGQIMQQFDKSINKMICRLNDQLIWRLQHENNADKRALINDFPIQMLHAKKHFARIVSQISHTLNDPSLLKGLFFTSATQQSNNHPEMDFIDASFSTSLINIEQPDRYALFSHDLLDDFLSANTKTETTPIYYEQEKNRNKLSICMAISLLLLPILGGWAISFKNQVQTINVVQKTLTAYQTLIKNTPSDINLDKKLQALDALHQSSDKMANEQNNLFVQLSLIRSTKTLNHQIFNAYHLALEKTLLPLTQKDLMHVLTDKNTPKPLLYRTLKTYLMLEHAINTYEPTYITGTMDKIWQTHYPTKARTILLTHLNQLLNENDFSIQQAKDDVISKIRDLFKTMNMRDLAELIIKTNLPDNQRLSLNLKENPKAASIFKFVKENITIEDIYTAKRFVTIYPNLIKKAADTAIKGDDVIGPIQTLVDPDQTASTLEKQMTEDYLEKYTQTWVNFINNIEINRFNKTKDLAQALITLSDENSLLLQIINLINANIPANIEQKNTILKSFNDITQTHSQFAPSELDLVNTLKNLALYLSAIMNDKNANKKAFQIAQFRMQNNGANDPLEQLLAKSKLYPEPIQSWLYQIGQNAWQLILEQTQTYINTAWQRDIIPQFDAQLANKFPFNESASNEINLTNFSNFFAPSGLLNNFFNAYLRDFINIEKMPWKMKKLNGNMLALPGSTMQLLERAYLIEHTYFSFGSQQISIPFSLTLKNTNAKSIVIQLGGQQLAFQNHYNAPEEFFWPDDTNADKAAITMADTTNHYLTLKKTGPWAWLKLIDNSTHKKSHTPKTYNITFHKDNLNATFALKLKQIKNPFDLSLLTNFRLPDQLF